MKKSNKGFTLVELIIVIVILAILVGVTIDGVSTYVNKARLNTDIQNANTINNILQEARMSKKLKDRIYLGYVEGIPNIAPGHKYLGMTVFEWSKATGNLSSYYDSVEDFIESDDFVNFGKFADVEYEGVTTGGTFKDTLDVLNNLFPDGLPECKSGNVYRLVLYYGGDCGELTDAYCHVYNKYYIDFSSTYGKPIIRSGLGTTTDCKYGGRLE